MRVGVYIDGFNLYYGGRDLCGRGTAGWRWLDLQALANRLITTHSLPAWTGYTIERIVYCTARISALENPVGQQEQANAAVEMLAGQIEGSSVAAEELFFEPELVARGSTGAAPAAVTLAQA